MALALTFQLSSFEIFYQYGNKEEKNNCVFFPISAINEDIFTQNPIFTSYY